MSETSSDAESSCGWTIISNEGSDIETMLLEAAVEYGVEPLERPPVEEAVLQDTQASASVGSEERGTLEERTADETFFSEDRDGAAGKEPVPLLSFSDHSDIMTLGDLKEDEHADAEEEVADNVESYLGSSCSSQYAFIAPETGLMMGHWRLPQSLVELGYRLRSQLTGGRFHAVFPVQQPPVTNSSSSEDEPGQSSGTIIRRRRVRKNTSSIGMEPEEEEALESGPSEGVKEDLDKGEEKKQQQQAEEPAEVGPAVNVRSHGRDRTIVNMCILLVVLIAINIDFGPLYDTVQILVKQRNVHEMGGVNELGCARDLLQQVVRELPVINEAQRNDLEMLLHQKAKENSNIAAQQQKLAAENQLLKSSLANEEKSLSTLQEELRNLRSKISALEMMEARAGSLLSENQRLEEQLKEQLEEKKQVIRNFHFQKEGLMAEAQTLRKKLETEREATGELRRELNHLRNHIPVAGKQAESEGEELQSRLLELEERLGFEQQRSDLWERLYVESKEDRAKGDTESKVKKPKKGVVGKVKETFDAVKNSTKEFVHHHKEQFKKAKEAVKENLRKFSDSVKSTFRNFKDSASTFINMARGHNGRDERNSRQHRSHKPHHRKMHKGDDSFHSSRNMRKHGHKVHEEQGQSSQRANMKGEFHQLLQSYLQQEVDHFHHWKELEMFINNFFHDGLFVHDRMLFSDFVGVVEDYLADMHEYHGLREDTFEGLEFIYRHLFGEVHTKSDNPRYASRGAF